MAYFNEIVSDEHDGDETVHTKEQIDFANFCLKLDWEGGIDGLIQYGGTRIFPEELQIFAQAIEEAMDDFNTAFEAMQKRLDVEY